MKQPKFGINIPQFHPDKTALADLGRFATHVESLGFDSVWTLDGLFHNIPFLEPLSSLAYIAALTKNVKLGTAVLLLPLRTPAIIAKVAATIDFLSSGRMILGTGLGGQKEQFEAIGVPMNERVPRFLEGIQIMRKLWTEDRTNFRGRFWQLQGASILPKPVQKGGIPIWIGGSQIGSEVNEKALSRAAQIGDGWLGAGSTSLKAHERSVLKFIGDAKKVGRDTESLAIAKRVYIHVDPDREKARRTLSQMLSSFYNRSIDVEQTCVYGSERDCAEQLRHLKETGTRTLILNPVTDHLQQAEILARDVIPAIS